MPRPASSPLALEGQRRDRSRVERSWLPGVGAIALIGAAAWLAGGKPLAVFALSFWHYYLYWLAYRYGAVPLAVFKRDALWLKSVALAALAAAYLAAPLDALSLAVVAAGFALNATAAAALGSDRTYYGDEVAGLPPLRITHFPYSMLSHPMLVGNMLAFGGTLLSAEFRGEWWALAAAHVALNFGLLLMERFATPLRLGMRGRAPRPAS
ncbi:MAG TPA: methyltransferase, partial [Pelomicrobium sp.]|nr:methyltransferase [Pelomicrobium sp.]